VTIILGGDSLKKKEDIFPKRTRRQKSVLFFSQSMIVFKAAAMSGATLLTLISMNKPKNVFKKGINI
jgi:hypothetical protein